LSQENVDLITRWRLAWAETDHPDWSQVTERLEVHDHDMIDAGTYRGRVGFERWLQEWEAAWSDSGAEEEEVIDAGDRVVVVLRLSATGRGSGIKVERQNAAVYELQDGKIARIDYYDSRAQALKSVGLDE
jgi:ketosteroid isomerase-like protein